VGVSVASFWPGAVSDSSLVVAPGWLVLFPAGRRSSHDASVMLITAIAMSAICFFIFVSSEVI
jgi:hypothetical protein